MKKAIFKFFLDCGRMGTLEGIFIAPILYIDMLIRSEVTVYFGEVLGKHSEIIANILEENIELITEDKEVIQIFEKYNLSFGYNPLNYSDTQGNDVEEIVKDFLIEYLLKEKGL